MSLSRKIRRMKLPKNYCPKCHKKLIEKPGYGFVCQECGYVKQKENPNE